MCECFLSPVFEPREEVFEGLRSYAISSDKYVVGWKARVSNFGFLFVTKKCDTG